MIEQRRPVLSTLEFAFFVLMYAVVVIARQTGVITNDWSILPVIETSWLNLLVVLALIYLLWKRKADFTEYGLQALSPFQKTLTTTLGLMFVDFLVTGATMPVLDQIFGRPEEIARFGDVTGNLPLLLGILPFVWVIGAFSEEFFFRGFLMTRIATQFGSNRWAWILAVIVQAIAFAAIHFYQGPANMISIGLSGLIYGGAYVLNRNLWPLVLAHGINNTLGFILLYFGTSL